MRTALVIVAFLLGTLFAATSTVARADGEPSLGVSPKTVGVGLGFSGAEVTISGTAPEVADVVLVVDGPQDSVKMRKRGKVMGLFWMTVEQAEVKNVPSFHVVRGSKPVDELLGKEEQVQLGVDPAATSILEHAQAVDPGGEDALSGEKRAEFVTALRDMYITRGQYTPWRCYHEAEAAACDGAESTGAIIRPDEEGRWQTSLGLPSDAPLGDYSVQVHYVRDSQVLESGEGTFNVEKVGMVDQLGTMAVANAPLYGAMALAIAIVMGLTIGFVFPRGGGH